MSANLNAQEILNNNLKEYEQLLDDAYCASIVGIDYFQEWIFKKLHEIGMRVEVFRVKGSEIKDQPAFLYTYKNPDSVDEGPNNVVGFINEEASDGILLYAHADKMPETYEYGKSLPHIVEKDGRYYGAGIADDVSGLAAMLSAVKLCTEAEYSLGKKVMIASILGKQGGVFGTYGLMKRYAPMNSAIYMHPAESGGGLKELKIASNGLIEFEINIKGKGPDSTEVHHTIFSRSAESALDKMINVYTSLQAWAELQSKKYHHEQIYKAMKQSFAITAGKLSCGNENESFEIPINCIMQGVISFPPNADLDVVRKEFEKEIERITADDPWLRKKNLSYFYRDRMCNSAESDIESVLIRDSVEVVKASGKIPEFFYGHSMSDIRFPLLYWNADAAYGIGPLSGNLGTRDEWVDKEEYFQSIVILSEIIKKTAGET